MKSNQSEKTVDFAKMPALNEKYRNNQSIKLISNYMKLRLNPDYEYIYLYSLKYIPSIDELGENTRILRNLILGNNWKQISEYFFPCIVSGHNLYSTRLQTEEFTFKATYTKNEISHNYELKVSSDIKRYNLNEFYNLKDFPQEIKTFFEVLFKKILNEKENLMIFNNGSIFDLDKYIKVGLGYLVPGYNTNIAIAESGIFVRADFRHKFLNEKTCMDKINELIQIFKNGELTKKIVGYFSGRSVLANYGDHKTYKIESVSFDKNSGNTCIEFNNSSVSLEEYYEKKYKCKIKYKFQPLLVSYVKISKNEYKPIFLLPELCLLTGLDEEIRDNKSLIEEIRKKTLIDSTEKMKKIQGIKEMIHKKNVKKKKNNADQLEVTDSSKLWGIHVSDFKILNGRLLDPPKLEYKDIEPFNAKNGRFIPKKIKESKNLYSNTWIVVCSDHDKGESINIVKSLITFSKDYDIIKETPIIKSQLFRNEEDWINYLESLNLGSNQELKMVLVVLDKFSFDFYGEIKKYLYIVVGIPCQVVQVSKHRNKFYYYNIINQMVVKMGGSLYNIYLDHKINNNVNINYLKNLGLHDSWISQ